MQHQMPRIDTKTEYMQRLNAQNRHLAWIYATFETRADAATGFHFQSSFAFRQLLASILASNYNSNYIVFGIILIRKIPPMR